MMPFFYFPSEAGKPAHLKESGIIPILKVLMPNKAVKKYVHPPLLFVKLKMKIINYLVLAIVCFIASPVIAGEADVIAVKTTLNNDRSYHFDVTVQHKDEGWKHYVNKWEVLSPKREILATRVLHHPHVNEQPFTRSLYSVKIPKNIKHVIIRAYDSVHHYGGVEQDVTL